MKTLILLCLTQAGADKLTLADAIRIATQNSPTLAASRLETEASKEGAKAKRADTLPAISANGFASTGNNSSIASTPATVQPPVWMLLPTNGFLDGNLSLMIPIFTPQARAALSSAEWQAKATQGDLKETQGDLSLQVTEAYERTLLARENIHAEEAKLAAMQELVRTTQAQFDTGKGIEATVLRAKAELSRAQRALTTARNEESKAVIDLAAAMNVDLASSLDPTDPLTTAKAPPDLPSLIKEATQQRGLLQAARARKQAALSDTRAADGQRKPQLYGSVMEDATNRRDMGGVSAGLTLSFPIFDGGRNNAEVSQMRAMQAKAEAAVKQAQITVEKEVRQAWLDVQSAQANTTSAAEAVKAAQSAYDVTALRVSAGKAILVEQLDALEALVRAKYDLAQSTYDQVLAVAKLQRATGGLK